MKIKVCGMRSPRNLEQVCALQPDFVGYIFYAPSKRYVGEAPDPELFRVPGPAIRKVGVFVNESREQVKRTFEERQLQLVQLHGDETPEYCQALSREGIPLIKAMDVRSDPGFMEEYREHVEFFLFDTPGRGYGGTGRKFDWNLLRKLPSSYTFLLSGGIGPDDAGALRSIPHKGLLGVDLNSGFESSPGMKEENLLKEFMQNLTIG